MRLSFAAAVLVILVAVALARSAPPRVTKAKRTGLSHPCSRIDSRTVRNRFEGYVRKMEKGSASILRWPDRCPFSPYVDLFGWHEKNKSRAGAGSVNSRPEWKCNYSGKVFKNEHYLDLHMELMYMNEVPSNGTCLEEYCEVLGFCKVNETGMVDLFSSEPPPCDDIKYERLKSMCESAIDLCLPFSDPEKQELNEKLRSTFCDGLTCEARAEQHFHRRKWSFIIGACFLVIMIGIGLACMCVELPEGHDSEYPANLHRKPLHGGRGADILNRHTAGRYDKPAMFPPKMKQNKQE